MRELTIGRRIGFGFGFVMLLLMILGIASYIGMSSIVSNAVSMINGNKIQEVMKQKEIDHLNWIAGLTHYMQDHNVKELGIATDDHKCGLGKWLYGEDRKHAEQVVPALEPILKSMEEPHHLLHQSALNIEKHFNKLDIGNTLGSLYRAERDHVVWLKKVITEIVNKEKKLSVQLDYRKCGFGKWMYSPEAAAVVNEYQDFAPLFERIKTAHSELHEAGHLVNKKLAAGNFQGAMSLANGEIEDHVKKVRGILQEMLELTGEMEEGQKKGSEIFATVSNDNLKKVQSLMHQATNLVEKTMITQEALLEGAGNSKTIVTILGIVALVLGTLLAFFIGRSLVNLLGRLASSMTEGAEQVASASGQVASSSQSLAEGSSEQAASLEETSSSLEEMASMTKQNADNANQADTLMKEANQVVGKANNSMEQLTTSMEEISAASEETSKIIKTIDEIAFQTNLLALNAAVEAARAGEAGAGFAVVADEVRNLALRAADAAKNTASLIEGTVKKVKDGSELVTMTNEAFGEVAKNAAKVGELVSEIAAASSEQSLGIDQVNRAVAEMDKVVQGSAASAEESASAAEELNAQAEQMKGTIGELEMLVGGHGNRNQSSHGMHKYTRSNPYHVRSLTGPAGFTGKTGSGTASSISCWEIKNCPNDRRNQCPAHPDHGSKCWMVTGTMCGGQQQGTYHEKMAKCKQCDVYIIANGSSRPAPMHEGVKPENVIPMDDAEFQDF